MTTNGVLVNEHLAHIKDEGSNSSNAWALEIHLSTPVEEMSIEEILETDNQIECERWR